MDLKSIFLPWLTIREQSYVIANLIVERDFECDISAGLRRDLIKAKGTINTLSETSARAFMERNDAVRELADLKSRAMFRDPQTGRLMSKGQRAAGKVA